MEHPNSLNTAKPKAKDRVQEMPCIPSVHNVFYHMFRRLQFRSAYRHSTWTALQLSLTCIHIYTQANKLRERERMTTVSFVHACICACMHKGVNGSRSLV